MKAVRVLTEDRRRGLLARERRGLVESFSQQQLAPAVRRQYRTFRSQIVLEELPALYEPEVEPARMARQLVEE